jgi:membrane-anchored protein YejM (alkaline phosphatase superfamily)
LRLAVHVPLLAVIGINALLGQVLLITHLPNLPPRELVVLGLAALVHASMLFFGIALVLGIVTRLASKRISATVWGFAAMASTLLWLDPFGYRWLDLHVDDTLMLLLWNLRGDFLVMKSKLRLLVLGVLVLLALLGAAIAFHRLTSERMKLGRYHVSVAALAGALLASIIALGPVRFLIKRYVSDTTQYSFRQAEWPLELVTPAKPPLFSLDNPSFSPPPDESVVEARLRALAKTRLTHHPNIFLFVVESLRADAISAEGTPNLAQLKLESLPVQSAEANGNCTHIAWFSLFNSSSPMSWSLLAKAPRHDGAVPLRALRSLGYQIDVLSTPSLHYYDTDHVLFSNDLSLASVLVDQAQLRTEEPDALPADLDRMVTTRLLRATDWLNPESGQFYAIFLDAPHHDYSWGRGFQPRYEPYLESISLLKTAYSDREIPLIKNRYLNAVSFVDTLLGEVFAHLKERGLWDDSIVIVIGDHGEEFMERGHLTHSSELNRFQTSIPFLFRIPQHGNARRATQLIPVASQVDVFPTVFDLLGVGTETAPMLWGTSLVGPRPPKLAVSARCTSFAPRQLVVLDGTEKLVLEFDGISSTNLAGGLRARRLRVVDLLNAQDESIATKKQDELRLTAGSILSGALQRLLRGPGEQTERPMTSPVDRNALQLGTRSPCCHQ